MEPSLKEKINEMRSNIRKQKALSNDKPKTGKLPNQYPNMRTKETVANLVSSLADVDFDSDNEGDTDDDMITMSAFMARTFASDPNDDENSPDSTEPDIVVKAHLEYSLAPELQNKNYAISDSGADSCILGKLAKVISYTGRHASLVGYDPSITKKEKVPIVSAYIKVRSSSSGNHPVLLKVNEAPYIPKSPITLLSEYQIREYGLVIDSVAKKHKSS